MLKGIDENGELRNLKVTEDGKLEVTTGDSSATASIIENPDNQPIPVKVMSGVNIPESFEVNNTTPIPVEVKNTETTLLANVATIGTTATAISVNSKVTQISIANYSETANVTMTIGTTNYVIGANIAVDLPINKTVTNIEFVSTGASTKIQYVIKGEE